MASRRTGAMAIEVNGAMHRALALGADGRFIPRGGGDGHATDTQLRAMDRMGLATLTKRGFTVLGGYLTGHGKLRLRELDDAAEVLHRRALRDMAYVARATADAA